MRKVGLFLLVFTLVYSLMPLSNADAATFPDVTQNQEEMNYLVERGIIRGYPDGTFGPERKLTRLQAVQMLLKAKNITDLSAPNPNLTDMVPGQYGYEEVAKAVQLGIISGKTAKNGTKYFDPGNQLTRGQMAKVIVEAQKLPLRKATVFLDVQPSNGFHDYISTLAAERITGGNADGTYRPNDNVSRRHFAMFVARMLDDQFKPEKVNEARFYQPDKSKTYVYEVFGGWWNETMTYAGTNYTGTHGWDLWKSVASDGEVTYTIEREDSSGYFYKDCENGTTCNGDSVTYLKYPLTKGQTWKTTMFAPGTYTIVATDRTVTTRAGTFHNVIEVKSEEGDLLYYAPNVGNIKSDAFGETVLELVEIR